MKGCGGMVDIAICGKDVRFCRMLELELRAMGFSVVREPNGGAARLWIIDLDTATPVSGNGERIYFGITRNEASIDEQKRTLCRVVRERPIRMETFREEITEILCGEPSLPRYPRARAVLCRTQADGGGFELNGEKLDLTETEEMILQALYDRRGEVVPRTELCALLENETNPKLADVYICFLRRKLETDGIPRLLFTVRGVGYRLEDET